MKWFLLIVSFTVLVDRETTSTTNALAQVAAIVANSRVSSRFDSKIQETFTSQDLEARLARTNYLLAVSRWRENRLADSYGLLYEIPEKHRNVEWHLLRFLLEGSDWTFYGHSSMVYSVACSPDGKLIASGDVDSSVKIWDTEKGIELRTLRGHRDSVSCVAFSPDGSLLASTADDLTICFWNPNDGQLIRTIGTEFETSYIAFSPDGSQLVSAARDRLEIWDVKASSKIRDLFPRGKDSFGASVDCLVISPSGSKIAATIGRNIHVWNAQNGEVINVLKGSEFDV
jgi:WD40 repeat protein